LANTTARSAPAPPSPDAASRPAVAAARVGSASVQTAAATFMRSQPATSLDDTAPMGRADVIALFGPTGVGKTEVALALAARLRELGERPVAISADALQVYDGLQTLTGAATASQRAQLEHRLIGVVPVHETFSAGRFADLAHAEIDQALRDGMRPIVVGGTGLYLRAALTTLSLPPPSDPHVRERLRQRM